MASSCRVDLSPHLLITKDDTKTQMIEETKTTKDDTSVEDTCLRTSQLVTEIILIVFAASLLLLAATIIMSKEIPALMNSYDIVPKTLFILCIIVATCSLMNWIYAKVQSQLHPKLDQSENGTAVSGNSNLIGGPHQEESKKLLSVASCSGTNLHKDLHDSVLTDGLIVMRTPATSTIAEE